MRLIDADALTKECGDWYVEEGTEEGFIGTLEQLLSVQPETSCSEIPNNSDTISRQAVTKFLNDWLSCLFENCHKQSASDLKMIIKDFKNLPSAQPDASKYEYHYDHTDCIWYRPEARNRCPVTCAQYRDGWNDAMNYIFRDGNGYRPYRRGEQYEG